MFWRGVAYPLKSGDKGLFKSEIDVKLIEGNIIQILGTRRGERVMLPLFGSNILQFIHEPLDKVTCALIRRELIDAITMWEPRVILDKENTKVIPYPAQFRVKADLRYFMKTYEQNYSLILQISRKEGVTKWLD